MEGVQKNNKIVEIGSKVKVLLTHSNGIKEDCIFTLTNEREEGSMGTTLVTSPLGKAVLGKMVDYEGDYNVLGKEIHVKVLSIE